MSMRHCLTSALALAAAGLCVAGPVSASNLQRLSAEFQNNSSVGGSGEIATNGAAGPGGSGGVVVYAPRQAVNDQQGFQQGAFAAVVDLADGKVTKLPELVSLAYFDPGCGDGEQAVLSRPQGDGTKLLTVDARKGQLVRQQTVSGQLTSAVPCIISLNRAAWA